MNHHYSILKNTELLIKSFDKPENFVREMIFEYPFLNFARDLHTVDSNSSYKYKKIMESRKLSKSKEKLFYFSF